MSNSKTRRAIYILCDNSTLQMITSEQSYLTVTLLLIESASNFLAKLICQSGLNDPMKSVLFSTEVIFHSQISMTKRACALLEEVF